MIGKICGRENQLVAVPIRQKSLLFYLTILVSTAQQSDNDRFQPPILAKCINRQFSSFVWKGKSEGTVSELC